MELDWDDVENEVDQASDETDAQLVSNISSLTHMKDEDVQALFPEKADKENLIQLMKIVNQATSENEKKVRLVNNIEQLAGTTVKLLAKFV